MRLSLLLEGDLRDKLKYPIYRGGDKINNSEELASYLQKKLDFSLWSVSRIAEGKATYESREVEIYKILVTEEDDEDEEIEVTFFSEDVDIPREWGGGDFLTKEDLKKVNSKLIPVFDFFKKHSGYEIPDKVVEPDWHNPTEN